MRTAEYPRPSHVIAHFTDTHLRHPESPLFRGVVDPRVPLSELLAGLLVSGHEPDALLFTGDLSDDGSAESYRDLRELVEPIAQELGAGVIWLNGNHDDRSTFRRELLGEPASDEPLNQVHLLGGLRVLCLDTTQPGEVAGRVARESLAWLTEQLATGVPAGTLLALHHAPLPVVQDLAATWELIDQAPLAAVLRGSDVRCLLGGHSHQTSFGTFAGIPATTATSTCYTQDLFTGRGIRGQAGGQGFTLVRVYPDSVHHTVVAIGRHDTVLPEVDAASSAATLARRGVRIAAR
ncbi:MAG: metallophosphoesterase [Propionicimonas sp.]